MKPMLKKISLGVGSFAALLMTQVALAQLPTTVQTPPTAFTSFEGLLGIVRTFLNWLFTALIVLAAIFIMMSAFYYLTAGGDEEKIKKAKSILIYAVVALVVGLVATSVATVIKTLVTTQS